MPICHHWGETCGHHKVLIHKQSFMQGSVISGLVALNMTVLFQFFAVFRHSPEQTT
jgi:hypothetical protein